MSSLNLILSTLGLTAATAFADGLTHYPPEYIRNCISEVRYPLGNECNRLPAIDKSRLRTYKDGATRYSFQYSYTTEQAMMIVVSDRCNWTQSQSQYKDVRTFTKVWNWRADQGPLQRLWESVDDFVDPLKLNPCQSTQN